MSIGHGAAELDLGGEEGEEEDARPVRRVLRQPQLRLHRRREFELEKEQLFT